MKLTSFSRAQFGREVPKKLQLPKTIKYKDFKRVPAPRCALNVFPIIDASGEMCGNIMTLVNEAFRELIAFYKDAKNIYFAPIIFSTGARWVNLDNGNPTEISSFIWEDIRAGGMRDFGAALKLLTEKLTTEEKGGWMKGRGGIAPVLILLSDGAPTDDYQRSLSELKKRGWFNVATKIAIALGNDPNIEMLSDFTDSKDSILKINSEISIADALFLIFKSILCGCEYAFKCNDKKQFSIIWDISEINSEINSEKDIERFYLAQDENNDIHIISFSNKTIKDWNDALLGEGAQILRELGENLSNDKIAITECFMRGKWMMKIYILYECKKPSDMKFKTVEIKATDDILLELETTDDIF